MWPHLTVQNADKETLKDLRLRAIQVAHEKAVARSKAKAEKVQEEKKYTRDKTMKLQDEERVKIQLMKAGERNMAAAELESWTIQQRATKKEEGSQRKQAKESERMTEKQGSRKPELPSLPKSSQTTRAAQHGLQNCSRKEKQADVPAPRSSGTIKIHFTPRVFPTALRESRVPEEEEWLKKQAAIRCGGIRTDLHEFEDLSEEERNPDLLKEKGEKYFVAGNYQAAINAYDLALRLNEKIPALYSNRAACHLKLRNLHKAIEDSSKALELLTPPVADNAGARMKAHVSRGTAFCELELYDEGLQDYQAALKIDPDNNALQADTQKIRATIQGSSKT
ncbi:dynein assembly factor 4, axonemal-like [Denticeps clupeoides]|nr:dynein assembly factor 4, axonemal-like [Denticeps clupeoides]XP_028849883.1 dynein assembly factor 4, axonemal-like [Denticeps clupeoides]XP_028849884.1 dynein assembly factor 4, axonemal-like [Denticeps clupeoides]